VGLSSCRRPVVGVLASVASRVRADKAAVGRAWREANPERVEAYRLARRVVNEPRDCVECGKSFVPANRLRLTCSYACRRDRRNRMRWWRLGRFVW